LLSLFHLLFAQHTTKRGMYCTILKLTYKVHQNEALDTK